MVEAIRPFVAQWRASNGKAPGQQKARDALAEHEFRVGTKRAGEIAELADRANADGSPPGDSTDRIATDEELTA